MAKQKQLQKPLKHPKLDEARALVKSGQVVAAADVLEQLATTLAGAEQVQVLCHAAQLLKSVDNARAQGLAERATSAMPDIGAGWLTLAHVFDESRKRKEAVIAAQRATTCSMLTPWESVDAGRLLARVGQDQLGLNAVRRGWAGSKQALNLASYTLRVALQTADWDLAGQATTRLKEAHETGKTAEAGETPRTHLLWCADEAMNIRVLKTFAERQFPVQSPMATEAWPGADKRRIRIGYLSSDFRDHATSLLALGLLRHHERERFELFAYCTSYDDGSALRRDMLNRFDRVRLLKNQVDLKAAQIIHADKIDILVDFNGLTEGTRYGILAHRPAPVQIAYLGFPGTVGNRFVDYVIADLYTVPPGVEALYPEKIIRIPPTYQINDYRARYLPPAPARKRLGLPEGKPVIGMFNNVNKLSPAVWAVWMDILKAVPEAVFWMLNPGKVAVAHLQERTKAAGVDVSRIIFAPKMKQEAHLARLQQCDLIVDPWPYGGHTTTADALFAGVPVIALEGTNFASRVSGGLLQAAGLSFLVAKDTRSYVALAQRLLSAPKDVLALKQALLKNRQRLAAFDAPMRTRQIEAGYLAALQRKIKGEAPDHITVMPGKPTKKSATPPAAVSGVPKNKESA